LAILVVIFLFCTQALAQDRDICLERDGARSIDACERTIAAGQLTGKDLATIYVVRATLFRSNGSYDRAIDDMTHAIELLTNTASNDIVASAYVTRASFYSLSGDLPKALADYQRALALDGANAQAAEGARNIQSQLASAKPATSKIEIAAPNEPLPPGLPISEDVLQLVQTHPFFAKAPPIRIAAYTVAQSMKTTLSGIHVSTYLQGELDVTLRGLRPGIIESDQSSYSATTTQGITTESSSQFTSVVVANGFIDLSSQSISKTSNQYGGGTGVGTSTLVRFNKLSGHIFPIEVGNLFSYETTSRSTANFRGHEPYNELIEANQCQVVRKLEARSFHPNLTGNAYLVGCDFQYTYPKIKSANNGGHRNSIFFNELGVWITADPVAPPEQVTFDGKPSKVGKYTSTTTGTYTLKSFSMAR
jgi:hypothetical protein